MQPPALPPQPCSPTSSACSGCPRPNLGHMGRSYTDDEEAEFGDAGGLRRSCWTPGAGPAPRQRGWVGAGGAFGAPATTCNSLSRGLGPPGAPFAGSSPSAPCSDATARGSSGGAPAHRPHPPPSDQLALGVAAAPWAPSRGSSSARGAGGRGRLVAAYGHALHGGTSPSNPKRLASWGCPAPLWALSSANWDEGRPPRRGDGRLGPLEALAGGRPSHPPPNPLARSPQIACPHPHHPCPPSPCRLQRRMSSWSSLCRWAHCLAGCVAIA